VDIRVLHRRRRAFPDATVLDVTSKGPQPWVRFSPFHPHGGIPVPLTPGVTGNSVEAIWQALKVFDTADVDPALLATTRTTGLKRTVRRHGPVRGHRAGLHGDTLLDYETARRRIYLPAYRFVLDHRLAAELAELRRLAAAGPVVLLDYTTNGDVTDLATPLSHAALIRRYLLDQWPAASIADAVCVAGVSTGPDASVAGVSAAGAVSVAGVSAGPDASVAGISAAGVVSVAGASAGPAVGG
jgi:hypothetical protein